MPKFNRRLHCIQAGFIKGEWEGCLSGRKGMMSNAAGVSPSLH